MRFFRDYLAINDLITLLPKLLCEPTA